MILNIMIKKMSRYQGSFKRGSQGEMMTLNFSITGINLHGLFIFPYKIRNKICTKFKTFGEWGGNYPN